MPRLAVFVALAGCAGTTAPASDPASGEDPETGTPANTEPVDFGGPGPWVAGTTRRTITGSDGGELVVQYWYPATAAGDAPVSYDGLLGGEAYEDVPADCAEVRPVLAFSHGYGGMRYQSPFFTERLATYGWVVVAPDHPGSTFLDPNGDLGEMLLRRPVDVEDTVDAVLAEPALAGCTAADAGYAVAGHSFGGYTALALAGAEVDGPAGPTNLGDPRVWAVLAFAPWNAFALSTGTADIAVPALFLTGELDETTPIAQVRALWEPMTVEPRLFGLFPGAGHYSFSPVACQLYTGDGCGDDFIDIGVFTELVDEASLTFLDAVRRGVPVEPVPADAPELVWQ